MKMLNNEIKPPKPPERPLMPYMRFCKHVWETIKQDNPDLKLGEIGKMIGQRWRNMPEEEKQKYLDQYEQEKAEYHRLNAIYQQSPAYQAYLAAKEQQKHQEQKTKEKSAQINFQEQENFKMFYSDEDDGDDGYSEKHIAVQRFHRNHAYIAELFQDGAVPDVRTVVTKQRMLVLQKQVQSLVSHQSQLEDELDSIEKSYQEKKRKYDHKRDVFMKEMDDLTIKCRHEQEQFFEMLKKRSQSARAAAVEPMITN